MSATAQSGTAGVDRYDPRHLQSKALERWERQQRVWDSVREALVRDTATGRPGQPATAAVVGSARNFTDGGRLARERAEDFGMIEGGVPRTALGTNDIWESQLRQGDHPDAGGTRLVQIGKAIYPYRLYGIVKDPASLKADNPAYTRTVQAPLNASAVMGNGASLGTSRTEKAATLRSAIRQHANTYGGEPTAAETAALQAAMEEGDTENDYYKQQLELYLPYIQQRFPHFMPPRDYLQVDGQPAPRMSVDEMRAMLQQQQTPQYEDGDGRPGSPTPVQYFPPPRSVELYSSRSGTATARNGSPRATPSQPSLAIDGTPGKPAGQYAARLLDPCHESRGDRSARSANDDDNGDEVDEGDGSLVAADAAQEAAAAGASAARLAAGPTLSLSTHELCFSGLVGELQHSELRITNTSSMTCYYSWETVDTFGEALEDRRLLTQLSAQRQQTLRSSPGVDDAVDRSQLHDGSGEEEGPGRLSGDPVRAAATPPLEASSHGTDLVEDDLLVDDALHALLHRPSASAQALVRLCSPLNGVLLPGETRTFSFAVRPPSPGYHTQTYELLTIPPLPQRTLIKVVVLADGRDPPAPALAAVVDRVLSARARTDVARQVVLQLTHHKSGPYEEADLRQQIQLREIEQARAAKAERQTRDRQRAQWTRANRRTMDGLPFNQEVYTKLERLHANLAHTMETLGQPLTTNNGEWGGSVLALVRDVHMLRDASSRAVFYEGLLALLRAARVSSNEEDLLHVLLRRAGEATAAGVAQRAQPLAVGEAELQQYTQETTVASLAGTTGTRRPGSTGKRGAGATGAAGAAGGKGASAGTSNNNNSAVEGTAPVVGSLRETLKAPTPISRAEEESLAAELAVLAALRQGELDEARADAAERYWHAYREAVDAACDLPLLSVVQATRRDDIATVQSAPMIDTKTSIEPPVPVAKATARKK